MKLIPTRRPRKARRDWALAEALSRAEELEQALSSLTRAVGTCKMSTVVDAGMLNRSGGREFSIRAPHVQDPRVTRAMDEARRVLGRAL